MARDTAPAGDRRDYRTGDEAGDRAMFTLERSLAWIFGLTALALGGIGLLRGFGIVGTEGVDIGEEGAMVTGNFMEGVVWLLPGIAASIVAWTMNRDRHTQRSSPEAAGMHAGAYLMAALAVASGALALLVGFGLLMTNGTPQDGVLWGLGSILYSLVAAALHAAPAPVADEDVIVQVVDQRYAGGVPGERGMQPSR